MGKPPKYLCIDDLLDSQKPRIFQLRNEKDIRVSIDPISTMRPFEDYGDLAAHLKAIGFRVLTLEEIEKDIDRAIQKGLDEVLIEIHSV